MFHFSQRHRCTARSTASTRFWAPRTSRLTTCEQGSDCVGGETYDWMSSWLGRSSYFLTQYDEDGVIKTLTLFVTCEPCIMCAHSLAIMGIHSVHLLSQLLTSCRQPPSYLPLITISNFLLLLLLTQASKKSTSVASMIDSVETAQYFLFTMGSTADFHILHSV